MRRQIVKNVFSNYAATALGLALGVFLIPFLIAKLGKEAFGLIVLAESTIAFFEVGTISVRIALSRHAAFSLARDKGGKTEFGEYLATGRGILLVSSALVLLIGVPLGLSFPSLFHVPEAYAQQSRVLFLLIVAAFSVTIPNIVFWSVLYAKQRFDLINFSLSAGITLRAISLFVLLSVLPPWGVSLVTYGLVYLLMTVLQNFFIFYWHRRVMPDAGVALRNFRREKVREILSFSLHTSVSRVSTLLSTNALDLLINVFWGPAFNTIYSVGYKFPNVLNRLFLESTWTLTPTFTEMAAKNDRLRLKRIYFFYTKLITTVVVPVVLLLSLTSGHVIRLWVGEGFEEAAKILSILVLPLATALPFAVSGCVFNAYGKVKWPSRVSLISALFNILFGIFLGKTLGLGLVGMAASAAAASIIYYTCFIPWYACRVAEVSLWQYWTRSFLRPAAWCSFVVLGGWGLFNATGLEHSIGASLGLTVFLAALCWGGAFFVVLDMNEKAKVRQVVVEMMGDLECQKRRLIGNPYYKKA